ncbi:PLAC8 family-domain-containing protein [Cantharellus anzutake]|uniref:PLAC8 family-domain-containing protein n=1 Tax=Cantharellus anzutake TaxID=1750568 RepID=UPI0019080B10|nr:PLAC8 family-domain-containing protein [Cantharellus anzutake]KAF8331622.1 PLAC8 family-domain-containing protein [Cantharellus anzutake]
MVYGAGAGGNRNTLNKPFNAAGQREWSFGTCDCFDACGTCLFACCCSCLSYGQNMSRLKHLESQGRPHPTGGDMCNGDCCVYLLLAYIGCECFAGMSGRSSVRRRYNIQGGGCGDCMCHTFCIPCSLTQESRELGLEEGSELSGKRG